jgi:hypothetical protein
MKNRISSFVVILAIVLVVSVISGFAQTMPKGADPVLWARALKLHKSAIVVDGHNDIVSPMTDDD